MEGHGFTDISEIGGGSYGSVVKATRDGKTYAIKQTELYTPESLRELDTLMRFRHPNIIRLHEFFIEDETLYLVMDYVPTTLRKYISRGGWTKKGVLRLIAQILSAFYLLHTNGVYHCDIKSANVLVDDGNIRVVDFSLVNYESNHMDICNHGAHIPPENLEADLLNNREEGYTQSPSLNFRASDIWGLGVLIAYIYTGVDLFDRYTKEIVARQHAEYMEDRMGYLEIHGVPPEIRGIVYAMLEPNPQQRTVTIPNILTMSIFSNVGHMLPIPGHILSKIDPPIRVEFAGLIGSTRSWMEQLATQQRLNPTTKDLMVTLFDRAIWMLSDQHVESYIAQLAIVCIWLAIDMCEWFYYTAGMMSRLISFDKDDLKESKATVITWLGGILR